MDNRPIAVIDSGVGGLASLGAIREAMPNEDIVYFGDTAFMPFGTKTEAELRDRATKIAVKMDEMGCKMIIVACNTMSCVAMDAIYKAAPSLLVQSMLEPATKMVVKECHEGARLGLIATPRCIESGVYLKKFAGLRNHPDLFAKGIPELSVFIENGITEGPQMESLLHSYMDVMGGEDGLEYILLGCTHYPLATGAIEKLFPNAKVLDPAKELAKSAMMLLRVHEFNADPEKEGKLELYASKLTPGFSTMAVRLGLGEYEIREVDL